MCIRDRRWTEMVRVLEKFLECDTNAFPTLKVVARSTSQIRDILDMNTTMSVLRQQLKIWVTKTWDQVSDLTLLWRLARLVSEVKKAPSSTLAIKLYDESIAQVQALLGEKFEVVMMATAT